MTTLIREDDRGTSPVTTTYPYDVIRPPACPKDGSGGCGVETLWWPGWRTPCSGQERFRGRSGLRPQSSVGGSECGNDTVGRAALETRNARSTEAVHGLR